MRTKHAAVLAISLCLAGAANVAAQTPTPTPMIRSTSISATATIQAIDHAKRTITLRDRQGNEDTYTVSPDLKRFDELKAGDMVKMTYYESVVFQVRKPGEKGVGTTGEAGLVRGTGELPAAALAAQDTMTVRVKAIDPAAPAITVTTPDGRTVTRKVDDKKHLEGVAVGDQVDITYTRALLTQIERAK